jgi:exonuclease SbcC
MDIEINNFRCHSYLSIKFDKGVCLIKGESGAGKTTILTALLWCLYGKIRKIDPLCIKGKDKTSVVIRFNNIQVTRFSGPNLLRVEYGGSVYQDSDAQNIIDNHIGTKVGFESLAYIGQKEMCTLISGTSSEKMLLLRSLIFDGESPLDIHMDKVKISISTEEELLRSQIAGLTFMKTELESLAHHVKREDMMSGTQIEELRNNIKLLIVEVERQRKIRETNVFANGQTVTLQNNITLLEDVIRKTCQGECTEKELEELKVKMESSTILIEQLEKLRCLDTVVSQEETHVEKFSKELNRLSAIEEQYSSTSIVDIQERLQTNEKRIVDYQSHIKIDKLRKSLELELTGYQSRLNMLKDEGLSDDNIRFEQGKCNEYKNSLGLANMAGIEYNTETIVKEVERLTHLMKVSPQMTHLRKVKINENRIKDILVTNIANSDISEDMLAQAQEKLALIRISKKSMSCPSCSTSLILKGEQLVCFTGDMNNKYTEEQAVGFVAEIAEGLKLCNERKALEIENINLRSQCTETEYIEINGVEVATKLSVVKGLKVFPTPDFNETQLLTQLTVNEVKRSIDMVVKRLEEIPKVQLDSQDEITLLDSHNRTDRETINIITSTQRDILTFSNLRDSHQAKITDVQSSDDFIKSSHLRPISIEEKKQEYTVEKTKYWDGHKQIEWKKTKDVELSTFKQQLQIVQKQIQEENLDHYISQLDSTKNSLSRGERAEHYSHQFHKATTMQNHAESAQKRLAQLNKFKEKLVEAEYLVLSQFIDSMNETIATISVSVFDSPIDIAFSVYKEIKTGNRVKPQINFKANYKGMEITHPNQLSGGEGDRLSLCIILALNKFFDLPILLLDETIGSLDCDMRERCIEIIKECISNKKPVLLINHDGVEGIFDQVVEVK